MAVVAAAIAIGFGIAEVVGGVTVVVRVALLLTALIAFALSALQRMRR